MIDPFFSERPCLPHSMKDWLSFKRMSSGFPLIVVVGRSCSSPNTSGSARSRSEGASSSSFFLAVGSLISTPPISER